MTPPRSQTAKAPAKPTQESPPAEPRATDEGAVASTALMTPAAREAAAEIEQIKQQGNLAVERKKVLANLTKLVEGLEWGTVKGAQLSPASRYALAEICYITGAHPQLHIDILGGRFYHNAAYYEDLINQHPHFIGYEQRSVTAAIAERLREQADQAEAESAKLLSDATELQMPELRDDAVKLRREAVQLRGEARAVDRARMEYGVPDDATTAYETKIRRYTPDAPLDAIRHGDIDGERFVQEVFECSWIDPKRSDPVGKAHPDRTCRTRSLRRGAKKAFSTWIEPKLKEVERHERAIEAEWTIVRQDQRDDVAALPAPGGPQSVRTGAGEPAAQRPTAAAQPLPTQDVSDSARNAEPESPELANLRTRYLEGCSVLGLDPNEYAAREFRGRGALSADDYRMLLAQLDAIADGEEREDAGREPGLGI